jgi:glucose/arabinose dehydrogenase
MKPRTLAVILAGAALLAAVPAPRSVPSGFVETSLATGLSRPVALAWLPGGRLLIGEQYSGAIKVFKNGAVRSTPFATVSTVYTGNNESGLLGLAVDPNFVSNGYVYVFVTQSSSVQRIIRYTALGDTGSSPTVMVDNIPTLGINHNGGGIGFGPDGYLYAAVGENGSAASDAQVAASWRGKVLRFDTSTVPASIPSSNPSSTSAVYSLGHRHPFRLAWRPGTGALYCSENGPNVDDEINRILPGANYGWPNDTGPNSNASYTNPVYTFGTTIAVTDLLFYTGSTMPFGGHLFYVDYKNDRIRRLVLSASAETVSSGPFDFVTGIDQPVDVEQGPDGAIYYCTLPGNLYKAQATEVGNLAPFASFTSTPAQGPPTLTVDFDGAATYDYDGSIVSYAWDFGDGSSGSGISPIHDYPGTGTYEVILTVTDNQGATGTIMSEVVCITNGNQPPSAHIESASTYSGAAPLTVQFAGHGHDNAGPLEHRWDHGDGSAYDTLTGIAPDVNTNVAHVFQNPGTYTVTLRVMDSENITAKNSVTITVTSAGPPAPVGDDESSKRCGLLGLEWLLLPAAIAFIRRRQRRPAPARRTSRF